MLCRDAVMLKASLSHAEKELTICPAPITPNRLTGEEEELYCLS